MKIVRYIVVVCVLLCVLLRCFAGEKEDIDTVMKEMVAELSPEFLIRKLDEGFVVATNGGLEALNEYCANIKDVAAALNKQFFDRKPDYVVRVYLLKDEASYNKYVMDSTGEKPPSPFGYCSGRKKLVVNVALGTGTIAHEMVHALLYADFPNAPHWLDEGLACLYEHCRITDDGGIVGRINWRLPALQLAIARNEAFSLERLMKLSREEFVGELGWLAAAQARYLCFYMQEKQVLQQFYRRFRDQLRRSAEGSREEPKLNASTSETSGQSGDKAGNAEVVGEPARRSDAQSVQGVDTTGYETFKQLCEEIWHKPVEEVEADFLEWTLKLEKE